MKKSKQKMRSPSKRIEELSKRDYVDPSRGQDYSNSDIHKPSGLTPHTSENESRDDSTMRTLAQAEEEERKSR